MAVVTGLAGRALRDTAAAFDGVASSYDRSNAENSLLCAMRWRTRALVEQAVPAGARLLDLGCGPGTDAVYFAAKGYRITAIDWSLGMVDEARRRVHALGLDAVIDVRHSGIEQLDSAAIDDAPYDGAYSHFGPLNCVVDLSRAARAIAARVRPGGCLIASVIGRVCPWEMALYLVKGNPRRAFLRFSRRTVAVPLEGRTVWTQYYRASSVVTTFARAGFAPVACRGLGLLVPPPYLAAFAGRHPSLTASLQHAEDAIGGWPIVRGFGDHFAVVMKRR